MNCWNNQPGVSYLLNPSSKMVQEKEMENLQTVIWSQLSVEERLKVIAVLVKMLLEYLAKEEQGDERS